MTHLIEDEIVVELYAAAGGVSQGLVDAGLPHGNAVGIEIDKTACETAEAAGHRRICADVTTLDPERVAQVSFGGKRVTGTHGSPPCQGLSMAGKGKGREDLEFLLQAVSMVGDGHTPAEMVRWLTRKASDERSPLTLEVLRWIEALSPDWATLEQVPAALPIWEAMAEVLRKWGYSVWTGIVYAEQYGVPQTRKRAILLASKRGEVGPMVPTHSRYYSRSPEKLDEGVQKWVSMAEALGWGSDELVGFPRKYDGRGEAVEIDGQEYRGRDLRETVLPGQTVTEKARSWKRYGPDLMLCPTNLRPNAAYRRLDQPAPTMAFGHETPRWVTPEELAEYRAKVAAVAEERVNNQSGTKFDMTWPADRPAPTVAGREIVTMPGANANRFNGSTKSRNDGLRVTAQEAGILQGFPVDYPWAGGKTKQFEQIGNAVPCGLAKHMGLHVMMCESATASAVA